MIDKDLIKEFANKVSKDFFDNFDNKNQENNINLFKEDLSKSVKLALDKFFKDLDLVTRQEFDIQNKLLEETRQKLDELKEKL